MISYDRLPEHMQDVAKRYVEHGIMPGHFLWAVLRHDLVEAFMRADDINSECMRDWAVWLFDDIPSACHGDGDKIRAWIQDTDGVRTETLKVVSRA